VRRPRAGLARIPLLSVGFRLFFLGAAVWAVIAMVLWLGFVAGVWSLFDDYGPVAWHAHEFLIGYVSAVAAGFLLTAIPNWTGRLPVSGGPLLALFLVWVAGRIALLAVAWLGLAVAMVVDSLFLLVFAVVILREIVAGRNWRNLKTVVLVSLLAASNVAFHVEIFFSGVPDYALRLAIAVVVGLIMLIGGRIIPSFTRNWLARRQASRLPAPFGKFDVASIAASGAALMLWIAMPAWPLTAVALLIAGGIQLTRMSRWAGLSTWREPLVLVLHGGYAFVPLGFILVGVSILWPASIPPIAALHAWSAGAVALMTLAVMTRASLGHTGHELSADAATTVVYLAALVAVVSRLAAPLFPDLSTDLLSMAAMSWIVAFGGFVLVYAPKLTRA
jgi:uncharacterized protein involved in response to NO